MDEKASLLLIDDEKRFAEATARLLRVEGFSVEVAFSGSKALEIYQSKDREFDIVITDLKMPVMDGIELIRHIRQVNPDQRIIVITAFSAQCAPWNRRLAADQAESEKPGSLDYLIKPFSLRQLLDTIDKSLKHEGSTGESEFPILTRSATVNKPVGEAEKSTVQETVFKPAVKPSEKEQARHPASDLSSVGVKLILEEAARELGGSAVCALVSVDGVSRAEINPVGFPKEYYSGKFSLLAYFMRNTLTQIGSGELKDFFLRFESRSVFARFIGDGRYYFCIVNESEMPLGTLLSVAGHVVGRLTKILE